MLQSIEEINILHIKKTDAEEQLQGYFNHMTYVKGQQNSFT